MIRPGSRLRVIRLLVGTFLLAAVGGLLARCAINRGQERRNAEAGAEAGADTGRDRHLAAARLT